MASDLVLSPVQVPPQEETGHRRSQQPAELQRDTEEAEPGLQPHPPLLPESEVEQEGGQEEYQESEEEGVQPR